MGNTEYVRQFNTLGSGDVGQVGGKNASLGEMIQTLKAADIRVPGGFATTAAVYWRFLDHNGLKDKIADRIEAMKKGDKSLEAAGRSIRGMFGRAEFPADIEKAIRDAYSGMNRRYADEAVDVAARSIATAEDLPDASFAASRRRFSTSPAETTCWRPAKSAMRPCSRITPSPTAKKTS